MRVEQLIIEVTRMCNMNCNHCLRGCSQNVYITKETIDAIFKDIDYVSSILFTGGEPFLNLDAIAYTLEVVKSKNIYVGEFFIITNGKHYEPRQIEVCNSWIEYIMSLNYNLEEKATSIYSNWDEDLFNYSGIAVSLDEYHESIPLENYFKYRMLAYYSTVKEHSDNDEFVLIDEGNAESNGIGSIKRSISDIYVNLDGDELISENISVDSILYISANGNVVGDCDLSYEHIDQITIGNVNDSNLLDIVIQKYLEDIELSA